MIQRIADKVVTGDSITVRPKSYYFVGSGEKVEVVKVTEVITLETDPDSEVGIPYPLFKVEKPDGSEETYTHRFFHERVEV